MYVYVVLSIFALLWLVECDNWWSTITNTAERLTKTEDARLSLEAIAHKYGYGLEEHQVITEDSYILNFHRIPNKNGSVVFLMHGISESADCWLLQGPETSLGNTLADAGFDVWMGNARGNKYSTKHAVYDSKSLEYWKFTWEQIAVYDLPAMIDYILRATGKESLYYIGHSQGTTTGYVLLSMKPDYNQKIMLMISLAPVAWMGNVESPIIRNFAPATNDVISLINEGVLSSVVLFLLNKMSPLVCNLFTDRCKNTLNSLMGNDYRINETLWPIIFGHMPAGSSMFQFLHYGQLVSSKRFCRFDYGEENIKKYGQNVPPDYDLNAIRSPVVLYYSDKDWLSNVDDVMKLKSKLPNVLDTVLLQNFGHMDYLYASDARLIVYDKIVVLLKKFDVAAALNEAGLTKSVKRSEVSDNSNVSEDY